MENKDVKKMVSFLLHQSLQQVTLAYKFLGQFVVERLVWKTGLYNGTKIQALRSCF